MRGVYTTKQGRFYVRAPRWLCPNSVRIGLGSYKTLKEAEAAMESFLATKAKEVAKRKKKKTKRSRALSCVQDSFLPCPVWCCLRHKAKGGRAGRLAPQVEYGARLATDPRA